MTTTTDFKFENGTTLRVPFVENETSWFIAADVCEILEIADTRQSVERLDDDEKRKVTLKLGAQGRPIWLINEFGLYSLILSSEKPEAKVFKRWITHDVIPALRKNGKYTLDEANARETLIQTKVSEIDVIELQVKSTKETLAGLKEKLNLAQIELKQILKADIRQMAIDFNTEQV